MITRTRARAIFDAANISIRRISIVATSRYLAAVIAAGTAAAVLAGCSSSQGSMTPSASSPVTNPMVKNHCPAHGGVRAVPCTIDFTASSPGPVTVTVQTPQRKKGTLVEQDNCGGASGMATVTQNPSDPSQWIIAAGATTGSCTATFNFESGKKGKIVGYANVDITNSI
jgi:ABC-type glycerol-3-phosphate transport system substrate-binding protein